MNIGKANEEKLSKLKEGDPKFQAILSEAAHDYAPDYIEIPGYKETDGKGGDALAVIKLFDPTGSWTWYATEYDPDREEFFGLVDGWEKELGYFSKPELESMRRPMGLRIERERKSPRRNSVAKRGRKPLFTLEVKEAIFSMYYNKPEKGYWMSFDDLGRFFGCSPTTVANAIRDVQERRNSEKS